MLFPKGNWSWYVDADTQCLAIQLDEELHFVTPYSATKLNQNVTDRQHFDVNDTQVYFSIAEKLDSCGVEFTAAQKTQIALNGVAATLFHKPIGLKSWFYNEISEGDYCHPISSIQTEFGEATVLVLEQTDSNCLCFLLSPELKITETKSHMQFDLLKVVSNRLSPLLTNSELHLQKTA